MEVLGAVAAAGQLLGTTVKMLDSIAQLRAFLQHAPARYREWRTELAILDGTLTHIRQNSTLQASCQVFQVMEAMAPKIETLTSLCARFTPEPKQNLIVRLNRAMSARSVESKILQSFESLEHDKTTLILTINTLNGLTSTSIENSPRPTRDMEEQLRKRTEMENINGPPFFARDLDHSGFFSNDDRVDKLQPVQSIQRYSRMATDITNMNQAPVFFHPFPQADNLPKNRFKNVTLRGDNCIFGNSVGDCAHFEDIDIAGNGRVDGMHSKETILAFMRPPRSFCSGSGTSDASKPKPAKENPDESPDDTCDEMDCSP